MEVDALFDAEAATILETFTYGGGSVGYRIPTYQRGYAWGEESITRLFECIKDGLSNLKNDKDSLTFIGTIICAKEPDGSIEGFDGKALAIVDGQQRLTTLSLMCSVLHQEISFIAKQVRTLDVEKANNLLESEVDSVQEKLLACIVGAYKQFQSGHKDFYPRIIREEDDRWHKVHSNSEFRSPVSQYIYEYIKYINVDLKGDSPSKDPFNFDADVKGEFHRYFDRNIKIIKNQIHSIQVNKQEDNDAKVEYPGHIDLLKNDKYKQLNRPGFIGGYNS